MGKRGDAFSIVLSLVERYLRVSGRYKRREYEFRLDVPKPKMLTEMLTSWDLPSAKG